MRPNSLRRRNDGLNKSPDDVSQLKFSIFCNYFISLHNFIEGKFIERSSTTDGEFMKVPNFSRQSIQYKPHTKQGKMYKTIANFYT